MSIALIILAAGESARLGSPKQLLPYRGVTLLRHTIDTALASVCSPVIIVLGAFAETIHAQLHGLPVHTVWNPDWEEGMGSSLRSGMMAVCNLAPESEAVVFSVCDQPFLNTAFINQLEDCYRKKGNRIVASAYAGEWGVPALFDRSLFDVLMRAEGKQGAKQFIRHYRGTISKVDFPEGNIDIDTKEDIEKLVIMSRYN